MAWENWLFDGIIFVFLVVAGAAILETLNRAKKSEKNRWYVLTFLIFFAWLIVFYGSFIEPKIVLTKNYEINLSNPSGEGSHLKAVVVSDFHLGPYNDEGLVEHVAQKIKNIKPDIIFLLGDFISFDNEDIKSYYPLDGLQAPLGIFAVTGNHDYLGDGVEEVVSELEKYNINFLRNQGSSIKANGKEIFLAGVDDYWYGDMDLTQALLGQRPGQTVILLAHNPDVVKYVPEYAHYDLMISGHTHGGQIRLPIIGSLVQPPTDLPRNIDKGVKSWQGNNIFITPGLGEVGPRARLFNFPEISVLNITY